ncbi:MAG: sugar ABC transporter substrate-binding protein [Fastidiosipilaceae bacterium]|jgi:inositol transport system substrate-binding protein|nr:substrate-binding domain-containing protein [Clostridiaceae bacterium]
MKRIVAIMLSLALGAAFLTGCGSNNANEEETTKEEVTTATEADDAEAASTEEAEASDAEATTSAPAAGADDYVDGLGTVEVDKEYNIGFTIFMRDQFLSAVEAAFAEECEKMGINQVTADANGNANTQINQVQTFASQGVDAIVVNLVSTDNAAQVIEAANGIPIAFVNRKPEYELEAGLQTFVGSDEYFGGQLQAEFLIDHYKNSGKDTVKYLMMQGTLGLQNTTQRTNAAMETLEASDINFECIYQDTAEWDRAKAQNKMQTFLGTGQEFDFVICNADEMALGCIEAMKSAGVDFNEHPVVGIDGLIGGTTAVKNGEMAFTVHQNAVGQGAGAARAAILMAQGKDVPTFVEIPFEPVTPENVDIYIDKLTQN